MIGYTKGQLGAVLTLDGIGTVRITYRDLETLERGARDALRNSDQVWDKIVKTRQVFLSQIPQTLLLTYGTPKVQQPLRRPHVASVPRYDPRLSELRNQDLGLTLDFLKHRFGASKIEMHFTSP